MYYSTAEKGKQTNEDKVALELSKIASENNFSVKVLSLQSKKLLKLKAQFKQEKDLELKQNIKSLKEFDFVFIGSPVVGSLTSAPLVNYFIRALPKQSPAQKKPVFALFVCGILPGFGLKKMQSLLSMKAIKPIESTAFTSMFEFDSKKLIEVKTFFSKVTEKRD